MADQLNAGIEQHFLVCSDTVDVEALRSALSRINDEASYSSRDATGFIADRIRRIQTIARAALSNIPAKPDDRVLVPREPSEAMLAVMHGTVRILVNPADRTADIQNDREVWSAMIAAFKEEQA